MAKRNPSSQTNHDNMVGTVARHLSSGGYRVAADLPGFNKPPTYGGTILTTHIPDVTAENSGKQPVIAEVETAETIGDAHTDNQWRTFSATAVRVSGRFWVVVPKGYDAAARLRASALGLQPEIFTV
jgi:hypothetical protein